ncbi:unnamed protein product, partial [Darwinula stevensoni]
VNLVFLVLGLQRASLAAKTKKGRSNDQTITWVKGSASLATLLGVTWIFGFLYVEKVTYIIFGVLFVFFNSFQGAFLFLFHVALNERVRRESLRSLTLSCPGLKKIPWLGPKLAETVVFPRSKTFTTTLERDRRASTVDRDFATSTKRVSVDSSTF